PYEPLAHSDRSSQFAERKKATSKFRQVLPSSACRESHETKAANVGELNQPAEDGKGQNLAAG
ncbi:MAG: hypothetical protein ACK4QP_06965, partial [Pseudorhizobium sp.]